MSLSVATSHLLVIDIQQKLLPVIADSEKLVTAATKLLAIAAIAAIVRVKASFTQQYPKGLGSTPASLQALAPEAPIFDKTEFSCMRDDEIRGQIEDLQRANVTQIVLAGAETHICVLQTASDLIAAGLDVFVAIDACDSRNDDSSRLGIERMRQSGVQIVNTEMVAFEWLERAATPAFKAALPHLK
jgi:nicotinamidase-related amidase